MLYAHMNFNKKKSYSKLFGIADLKGRLPGFGE
jgi:hypothetical protein